MFLFLYNFLFFEWEENEMISSTVVKKFDGEKVAEAWTKLDAVGLTRDLMIPVEDYGRAQGTPRHGVSEVFERAEAARKSIRSIVGELNSYTNPSLAMKLCAPSERVLFKAIKTRVDELSALETACELVISGDKRRMLSLREQMALFGPFCGRGRYFWFGGLDGNRQIEDGEWLCPPLVQFYVNQNLNRGESVFEASELSRLNSIHLDAKQVQGLLAQAENRVFREATENKSLPSGRYRFGFFLDDTKSVGASGWPAMSYGEFSGARMPRALVEQSSGLEVLELVGAFTECELRTAISTRELFYSILEDQEAGECLRPLVPLLAKSLNETLIDGLCWFSSLEILGLDNLSLWRDCNGMGVILDYVLNRAPYQIESGESLMRYACLSLEEVRFILEMEMKADEVFAPDRFSRWGYLMHQKFQSGSEMHSRPMLMVAEELLNHKMG